jgi:ligand-binding sensor domain-containing protein
VVGPEIGYPGGFTNELTVDRHGALWVAGSAGVHVLPRGGRRFAWRAPSLAVGPYEVGTGSVRAAPDGSVWALGKSQGIMRLSDSAGRPLPPSVYYDRDLGRRRGWAGMFIDRHSRAWGATADRLVRVALGGREGVPPGAAVWDTLPLPPLDGRSGAMTGNQAHTVFEDREGTIWVATETGLEQFRVPKVTPVKWPVPDAPAIAAADGGALWAADDEGTLRLVGARDDAPAVPATLPNAGTVAYRDLSGEVWMGGVFGLWHLREGRFTAVALPPEFREAPVVAIARDRDGVLWVGAQRRGVFRQRGGAWERYSAPGSTAYTIVADSAGRTWLAYRDGRLVREGPGAARTYGPADGLRVGSILTVVVRGSRVWVGGELGVAVADLGAPGGSEARPRFAALVSPDRPFRGVGGIVAADDAVWLHDADGLARIESAEVARALRDARYRVRAERFDHRDRVDEGADFTAVPSMVAGTDGRLWVTWLGGVGLIDPANLPRNRVPPPVHIRMLDAGGEQYAATSAVTLPERTRALRIAYTATSLAVPERVRFRYRLLGLDTTWQEAGARREAFYTNLGPGEYHFQVVAANDDGVWNTRGAALDVVIPPTFWQTNLFLALCVGAASGAVVLGAQWRQRRAADAIRARFAVTLAERTRVARELHDTLLSGVAGIAMRLDAVATRAGSPAGVDVAALDELREQARHTLVDARRAVVGCAPRAMRPVPVSAQLAEAARRVFAGTDVNARVGSTGHPVRLPGRGGGAGRTHRDRGDDQRAQARRLPRGARDVRVPAARAVRQRARRRPRLRPRTGGRERPLRARRHARASRGRRRAAHRRQRAGAGHDGTVRGPASGVGLSHGAGKRSAPPNEGLPASRAARAFPP